VRWFASIVAGIAVVAAWLAIWTFLLHSFGISAFPREPENRASRRERIKRMGELRYILVFGVFGFGLAFGLAITVADLLTFDFRGWTSVLGKLAMLTVLFGWLHGARTWSEAFRDPVPFPPEYPPPKNPVPFPPNYPPVKQEPLVKART